MTSDDDPLLMSGGCGTRGAAPVIGGIRRMVVDVPAAADERHGEIHLLAGRRVHDRRSRILRQEDPAHAIGGVRAAGVQVVAGESNDTAGGDFDRDAFVFARIP